MFVGLSWKSEISGCSFDLSEPFNFKNSFFKVHYVLRSPHNLIRSFTFFEIYSVTSKQVVDFVKC
jgi:hypothetical protein